MSTRTLKVVLRAEVNQFKADMAAAGKASDEAAKKTETAWDKSTSRLGTLTQQATRYSSEMTNVGTAVAGFGAVVVGGLGLATKAAVSWESAWAGVLKTVDGTPKQLAQIEQGLRDLAKTLPASHEEIAAVAEAAGQLGIQTDNVVSFTKTMIDMGEATNLSAGDAATSLARFMNIMGTGQKDVGKLGAAVVGLGNNFATTEAEIVEMSLRIAGAGKQAGMSEGDVLGFATALSSVGIEAEAGGTAISQVMKRMGNAVADGGDSINEYARIAGMSAKDFAEAWGDDSAGTMAKFIAGLQGAQANGENVNATLSDLGITGIRESDALLRLSSANDVLVSSLKMGNDEYARGTALAEEAAKRYETAESRIRMAGNALKDAGIEIGATFLPMIANAADAVVSLTEAVDKVPDPVMKVGGALAGVAGAAALVAGGALVLIPRIAETVTAVNTLRTASANSTGVVGKLGGSLGRLRGIATSAAVGLTAVALASQPLSEWGNKAVAASGDQAEALQLLSGQIAASKIDIDTLNQAFTDLVATKGDLGEFGNAVNEVINPNMWGVMDDVVTDVTRVVSLGMVDMKSSTEEARERFSALGEQLALLQSTDAPAAEASFAQMVAATDGTAESISNLIDLMPPYKDQLIQQAQTLGLATDNATLAKIALGEIQPPDASVEGGIEGIGDAAADAGQSLTDMLDGLLALGLATLSERDALRGYEEAVRGISESIEENGTSMDITTAKGSANQAAFDAIADAGIRAAQSMAENNASQKEVQGQLQKTYDDLVTAAGQFGKTGDEADEMAREVLGIPDEVDIKTWMSDSAEEQAKNTADAVNKIPTSVTVKVNMVTDSKVTNMPESLLNPDRASNSGSLYRPSPGQPGPWKRAAGGIDFFAAGGFMDPIAQMVPPNTWRVVGDRSDVPEAFIPLDGSARSRRILLETMRRMPGMQFMAQGGVSSARRRLSDAERDLERIQKRGQTTTAEDRRREAAQKRVEQAREAVRRAEERQREADRRAEEERARRERVDGLRTDLRTDVRRGNIRDQVTGSLSGGYSAVDRLFGLGRNEDLSRSNRNRATASARKFESDLKRLYGQAERLDEKLKAAQDKASELEGIQKSVASGLLSGRDLDMGDYMNFSGGQWTTHTGVQGATRRMTADVGRMKEFANKLQKLMKAGIPGAILQEIAGAGVEEGIALADSFLNASGAEQQSYISTWNEYEKQANRIGNIVTGGFYDGGVDAARGVVNGLESQQKSIEAQIARLAKSMEDTLKSVLGIRSPSRVMAELGAYTVEGLVQGMLSGQSDVTNAASLLAGAAIPNLRYDIDMTATPVVDSDAMAANTAMQDMSAITLGAMQSMRLAVSDGWTQMLTDTQTAQAGMLTDTTAKQFSMRDITAQQQEQMRAVILGKQTSAKDSLTSMQESMRSTVADRQLRMRDNIASQQESMRSVMADKQTQMRDKNRTEFESMRATTGEKLTSMRSRADSTMAGFRTDYDGHMGSLKRINREGHTSMEDASEAAFKGIRSGMNTQMREARPELGGKMNNLIDVLSKFTSSVNKAFGDVGVDLSSPQKLSFATGGVMPGYTPGRDVHSFYSPTAGSLYLSGGEAIMRPEFTKAVGGEQGVKELNAAARRGDGDYLNQALHFAQGGVMPSTPMRGVNAFADSGVWRGLWAIVKSAFPNAIKTSDYRPGSRTVSGNSSYHSRGMAVDVSPSMGIFNYLHDNYGGSNEIIYSPANGRQIKNGRNYMYTGGVRAQHFNHVHWANSRVPGGAAGGPAGAWDGDTFVPHPFLDKAGVSAGGDLKAAYERAAKKQIKDIIGKHSGQLSGGDFSRQLGTGIMRATRDGLIKKATDYGELMGDGGIPGAANGPVKAMAREVLEKMGWGDQWADLDWLVTRESGWNPNAQNPTSTAYGLFQFLNGTWGSVGATKTSDPLRQIQAGLKYIQQRYGDVRGARRFWERNNWYADGAKSAKSGWAVVGEEGPELINLGGGERIESNRTTRAALAANRTFITPQSSGVDAGQIAKIVASELAKRPQLVQNIDSASMTETTLTRKVAQRWSEDTALYMTGVS